MAWAKAYLENELWVSIVHSLELPYPSINKMSLISQSSLSPATEIMAVRSEGFNHQNYLYFVSHITSFPTLQVVVYQSCSTALHLSHYFRPPNSQAHSVWMCWHCFQEHKQFRVILQVKGATLAKPIIWLKFINTTVLRAQEQHHSTPEAKTQPLVQNMLLVMWPQGRKREGNHTLHTGRSLTANVLSPTLEAMRPSIVPYSASLELSLSMWFFCTLRMISTATAEKTINTTTGARITMISVSML